MGYKRFLWLLFHWLGLTVCGFSKGPPKLNLAKTLLLGWVRRERNSMVAPDYWYNLGKHFCILLFPS